MEYIVNYFSGLWGTVELLGTISSLICVYLATKHNQWTWYFGFIGVVLFGALFYEFQLYSDMGLQLLFFAPMQIWGFLYWQKTANESNTDFYVENLGSIAIVSIVVSIAALTFINGSLMSTYTDASFPYADAWTTWMSVFAQILMIRKFWESWVLWIVMDIGAIFIYFSKELYIVSGLYVMFLVLATIGLIKWYNDWKAQQSMIKGE